MRLFQSAIFRALAAIIVGILLVKYREDTMRWITIAAGGLFFVSGLLSFLAYLYEKQKYEKAEKKKASQADYRAEGGEYYDADGNLIKRRRPTFPILGIGCMLLGIILAVMPTDLIKGVTYVLASILILGSINQIVSLALARRHSVIPFLYWLFPLVILGTGIFAVARPLEAASLPLKIIGWGLMIYGIIECVISLKIYAVRRQWEKEQEKAIVPAEPYAPAETKKEDDDIEDAVIVEE